MFNRSKLKLIIAFSTIYIIWGSTYLANKFVLESIPPFIFTGLRFTIAGIILMIYLKIKGETIPKLAEWKNPFIIGAFMLFIGNGFIAIAQQKVPSGLTALFISVTPLYMSLINWLFHREEKPLLKEIIGIIVGFFGMVLLIESTSGIEKLDIDFISFLLVIFSPLAWVFGSIYSKKINKNNPSFMPISIQMLSGGILLLFFSFFRNEWSYFSLQNISLKSILSLFYLIIFGSIITYSAYIWLLKKCPPTLVSTNTFVNPIIALILGTTIANEILTFQMILSSIIIISSVVIITLSHLKKE